MAEITSIYDGQEIAPIARIKQRVAVYTNGIWEYYKIDYQEPMPPSSPLLIELVAIAGLTAIPANGTVTKQVITALQLSSTELLQARWEPIDPVEGILWEKAGLQRFGTKNSVARVDLYTRYWDPNLATTTFFVMGTNRDMNLEARNPLAVAQPTARFQFYGHRYVITALNTSGGDAKKLKDGDEDYVAQVIGPVTWLPAEGRLS